VTTPQPPTLSLSSLRNVRDKEEAKRDLARKQAEAILHGANEAKRDKMTYEEELVWRQRIDEMRRYQARVNMLDDLISETAVE
jgi:hypothetical protein